MFHLWLVRRFVFSDRRLLTPAGFMSILGMALGVASLLVAMGVVSGFEQTLRTAIIDVFGDVMLVHKGEKVQSLEAMLGEIKKIAPEAKTFTPFVELEGIVVGHGQLSGVIIQGFDPETVEKVLNLRTHIVRGEFKLGPGEGGVPRALIGKTLAKKYALEIGQGFKAVLPTPSKTNASEFAPKIMSFIVAGVLDLGKADYDERYVVTDLQAAQEFAGMGENFSGIRIKLENSDSAREVSGRLQSQLGPQYWTKSWPEVENNLFRAVTFERIAIFIIILTIVVVASFNIASNLFVNVLKRTADISILRALGFTRKDVQTVFVLNGLMIGAIGAFSGLLLGLVFCWAFVEVQKYFVILPAETYRIDHIGVELRALDVLAIVGVSMLICLLATLWPARKGAALNPVEGLRYE